MTKLIKPKNTLKGKVGTGGFNEDDLKKAQIAIEENKVEFEPIARDLLDEVGGVINSIKASDKSADKFLGPLLDPLLKLRAQGALFHYPSITYLTDIIVDFLDSESTIDDNITEIITAYKKAGSALLAAKAKNTENSACQLLAKELESACLRYKQKKK